MRFRRVLTTALAVIALAGACSDKSKVGEGIDESQLSSGGSGPRLGETTTTEAPATTTPPAAVTTAKPAATTAPPATAPPTTAQAVAITIKIQSDTTAGGQFNPSQVAVKKGALVRWTNTDTVERSVEADNGAFQSPMIPAGGSWDYKTVQAGSFNYHDGTRPYAVGALVVSS